MAAKPYPRIPYGMADFMRIRADGRLYVDKTRFIRALEEQRYAFLIRPRRFGKSLWLSVLHSYYDRTMADDFERLFGGTDIGLAPTPERNRHVILHLDFSVFGRRPGTLEQDFEEYCGDELAGMLERNSDRFPEAASKHIRTGRTINSKLNRLFRFARDNGVSLYVPIDEYDNFANDIQAYHGEDACHSFTHGSGFYRSFFATLKGGTEQGGGLDRLLITGVSPITLDDVTSGFNIGTNVSLSAQFNELLGFTEAEVAHLLEMYRDLGVFRQDVDEALATMREWYDGYRFAKSVRSTLYNTDMVLYYLRDSIAEDTVPDRLIDRNVRIDYGKLRHLLAVNRELNGNFDLLREIATAEETSAEVQDGFPLAELGRRENFASLLHYFGLLSIRGVREGETRLGVPNQTVKHLMYGYLRDRYRDVGVFSVDEHRLSALVRGMAYRGAWQPAVEYLATAVKDQTGIRDYIAGEKVIQGFLAAYLGLSQLFLLRSEHELGKGYADLFLEPFVARYPDLGFSYVFELKYLRRSERAEEDEAVASGEDARGRSASARLEEAKVQLRGNLGDERLGRQYPSVRFIGIALVFHGWELVACEAVETDSKSSR